MNSDVESPTRLMRLLLPVEDRNGTEQSWRTLADKVGYPGSIDGYSDWNIVFELNESIDTCLLPTPPAGLWPRSLTKLLRSLDDPNPPCLWHADSDWKSILEDRQATQPFPPHTPRLSELNDRWSTRGFWGIAYFPDYSVAAPPYCDSFFVRAEVNIAELLEQAIDSLFPISATREIPFHTQ